MQIKLFATLKDLAGTDMIEVTADSVETVAQLLEQITIQYPSIAHGLASSIVAVNKEFADNETTIVVTDEIALFPPVSGG